MEMLKIIGKDVMKLLKSIAKDIEKAGGRVYLVGGLVRDKIIGLENKDVDLEIHGLSKLSLLSILTKYGEVNSFGAKFGIYQIKGFDIDFALPRTETKNGEGHTDFDVVVNPFLGLEEATLRRDLTINGIYQDLLTNELIDHCGGIKDISNKIIRHINSDTFVEDSLRVLRACQFASRFEFKIADETIELCRNIDLSDIAVERVYAELEKAVLKGKKPSLFFSNLKSMGKLSPFFNELELFSNEEFNDLMDMIDNLSVKTVENVITLIGVKLGEIRYVQFVERFTNRKNLVKPIVEKINALNEFYNSDGDKTPLRRLCFKTKHCKKDIFIVNAVLSDWTEFENNYELLLNEVKKPIVTSSDLFEIGNIPNEKFGLLLRKGMEYQIQGFTDKEKILRSLQKHFL